MFDFHWLFMQHIYCRQGGVLLAIVVEKPVEQLYVREPVKFTQKCFCEQILVFTEGAGTNRGTSPISGFMCQAVKVQNSHIHQNNENLLDHV